MPLSGVCLALVGGGVSPPSSLRKTPRGEEGIFPHRLSALGKSLSVCLVSSWYLQYLHTHGHTHKHTHTHTHTQTQRESKSPHIPFPFFLIIDLIAARSVPCPRVRSAPGNTENNVIFIPGHTVYLAHYRQRRADMNEWRLPPQQTPKGVWHLSPAPNCLFTTSQCNDIPPLSVLGVSSVWR